MAAIYGFIDVNAEADSSANRHKSAEKMHDSMKKYMIDKTESCFFGKEDAGFFSCAHQFFTRESVKEVLPLSDEDIVFTMDGMIDNREEIISFLSEDISDGTVHKTARKEAKENAREEAKENAGEVEKQADGEVEKQADSEEANENTCEDEEKIANEKVNYVPGEKANDIPDGKLVYLLYKKLGKAFVNKLLGIFAIAIYEKNTEKFYLYTDHTGSRCVNYCFADGRLAFSTTFGPILAAFPKGRIKVSEKFIINCECNNSPDMITVAGPTLYEGVFQLKAGHYLEVSMKELDSMHASAKECRYSAMSEMNSVEACKQDKECKSSIMSEANPAETGEQDKECKSSIMSETNPAEAGEESEKEKERRYFSINEKQWNKYLFCYWNPLKSVKKIKGLSQQEYRRLFLDTFAECVRPLLRANGNTAATLSAGLDSSAVCCMALPMLAERGDKLYSFTSVPEEDFVSEQEDYFLTDESKGPKTLAKYFDNLCPELEPCNGESALTHMEELVDLLEMPVKSAPNLMWLSSIYKRARKERNCRILLKGQFGNSTISYGEVLSLFYQQLLKGKVFTAKKTLKAFMKRRHVSKANVKHVIRQMLKEKLHTDTSVLDTSIIKKEVLKKSGVYSEIKKAMNTQGRSALMNTDRDHRNFIYSLSMYQHLSMYDTRLSLAYGILPRDPAKDKRMIELCLALPMECFVNDGIERNMVRGYMEGIVPAEIRNDVNHRGSQSADFINRMEKYLQFDAFANSKSEGLFEVINKTYGHLFCEDRLKKVCEAGKLPVERKEDIQQYVVLYAFGVFLKMNLNEVY